MKNNNIFLNSLFIIGFSCLVHFATAQTSTQNYVRTRTMTNSAGTSYLEQVEYYDGLGRPSQVVEAKMGGASQDLVSLIEYDATGRREKVWLPAVRSGNNSAYVSPSTLRTSSSSSNKGDNKPYSLTVYEPSPLNRVTKEFGPGNDWHTNDRAVHTAYKANTAWDGVYQCRRHIFIGTLDYVRVSLASDGYYASNLLYVTETKDEDNNPLYTFTDKEGHVILTRQISGSTFFDTYYIYDDYGHLRVVLPPLGTDGYSSNVFTETSPVFMDYAYMYKYNDRGHCIAKKLPGADWIYYIYDKADRLIFSQDGEQRTRGEWRFTIPDRFGRVVLEGICKNSLTYNSDPLINTVVTASWSGTTNSYKGYTLNYTLTTATTHSAWYYDNYNFCSYNGVPARSSSSTDFKEETRSGYSIVDTAKTQGLLTGELHMMLKGTATTLSTVYYYDNRGRMVQTKSKDHNGKINKEFLSLAFDGLPEKRFLSHRSPTNTEYTEEYLYAYDHARRPTTTTHKWNGASTGKVLEANTYDALGRISVNIPMDISRMKSTHSYDVRSRAEYILRGFFNQHFGYTYGSNISSYQTYLYYGNKKYDFTYDGLSRLTNAAFSLSSSSNFASSYSYDKNGNIMTIQRYGRKAYQTYGLIDQITMVRNGNRVVKATDGVGNISDSQSQDFKDYVNKITEYTYNQNGAMTQDQNRGITSIAYNILNLPEQIDIKSPVAEARNEYYYSSDGVKRRVIRKWNPNYSTSPVIGSAINTSSLTQTETTDYVGNVEYVNNALKRVYVGTGYIENNVYHCYLKDYLGNTRMVATPTDSMYQWLNYYPFGMLYGDRGDQGRQQMKYGGKEFDDKHGLYLYDFEARYYDPALGGFLTMDPLAEKYYSTSPYAYCLNNPMRFVDPTGMSPDDTDDWKKTLWQRIQQSISSLFSVNIDARNPETVRNSFGTLEKNAQTIQQATEAVNTVSNAMSLMNPLGSTIETVAKVASGEDFTAGDIGFSLMEVVPGVGIAGDVGKAVGYPLKANKVVNVTSKARDAETVLNMAQRILKSGYKEISPGVFRSSDNLRQFRMTNADLLPTHNLNGKSIPHVHFEFFSPHNLNKAYRNYHVPLINK